MIETGATKLTLASLLSDQVGLPDGVTAAAGRLKAAVGEALSRAQRVGAVRETVTVEEVYLLVAGLTHASAAMHAPPDVLRRAIEVVLAGMAR